MQLPDALGISDKDCKFISTMKRAAVKEFAWTKIKCVRNTFLVGLHFYICDDPRAQHVFSFLSKYEFAGNYDIWHFVETALVFRARDFRLRGEDANSNATLQRIQKSGNVHTRLAGRLLDSIRRDAENARRLKIKKSEIGWLESMYMEIIFNIELGPLGDRVSFEVELEKSIIRLRELTGCC